MKELNPPNQLLTMLLVLDRSISDLIYKLKPKSELLEKWIKNLTRFYGVIPFFLVSILISNNLILTFVSFIYIILINFLVVENGLKKLVKRQRPLSTSLKTYSFPSTHASTGTLILLHLLISSSIYNINLPVIILLLLWFIFVAISRVIYGHHYFFDIIFGIIIGFILAIPFALAF